MQSAFDRGLRLLHPIDIEVVAGVTDISAINVPHSNFATWAVDRTGRQWVRKRESNITINGLLAESIGWAIGQLLGAAQPAAAVFHDGVEWSWLSERLTHAVEHWDPSMAGSVSNLESFAAVLVTDVIVMNPDRHARNILAELDDEDASLYKLWAIDPGDALVGFPDLFVERVSKPMPPPSNHARSLPIAQLRPFAVGIARRAVNLSEADLVAAVQDGCILAREPAPVADALSQALVRRNHDAPALVERYLEELGELG